LQSRKNYLNLLRTKKGGEGEKKIYLKKEIIILSLSKTKA
jgi:hypothetical protein